MSQPLYVFSQSELDPAQNALYQQYLKGAYPLMVEYGVQLVMAGDAIGSDDGHYETWPNNVILKYPSPEAHHAFINDPRYIELGEKYGAHMYKRLRLSKFVPRMGGPESVARRGFELFCDGLLGGDLSAFYAMLSDDFIFWFPSGKYKGENMGKANAIPFFNFVLSVLKFNKIDLERVYGDGGSWFMFEFQDEGTLRDAPYHNRVAIALQVRGQQICAYREYFGLV
jgi:ketosteroid isomerase-like protein/uncharacterized protein (DUF1330 family)